MFKIRNLGILFIICFVFCNSVFAFVNDINIFVIDMERIVNDSEAVRDILNKLEIKRNEVQYFMQIDENLKEELESLKNKESIIKDYKQKLADLEKDIEDNKSDMNKKLQIVQSVTEKIMYKINECLNQATEMAIDKDNNPNSFVFNKGVFIYFPENADITNLVQEKLSVIIDAEKKNLDDYYNQEN